MPCAIDLARIAAHAFGIGEIAGRGVQPDGFGVQSASGHIEYIE
jgi:hypothetical protein